MKIDRADRVAFSVKRRSRAEVERLGSKLAWIEIKCRLYAAPLVSRGNGRVDCLHYRQNTGVPDIKRSKIQ